ncbi:MAG TPA: hypothetical protein V6D15_23400 [Oculatellaceae cyanobacterium]|jgi:hypothetical protein
MNIKSFSTNFRAGCVGLTTALMLLGLTSTYAQADEVQSNGSTKVTPLIPARALFGQITAALARTGGQNAALIAAIQSRNTDAIITALVAQGINVDRATRIAAVIATLTPSDIINLLSRIQNRQGALPASSQGIPVAGSLSNLGLSTSRGTLVASSEPILLAQASGSSVDSEAAVAELYNTFSQAFVAGGNSASDAQKNASNLLVALTTVKYAITPNGSVDIRQVNQLARLIQSPIAVLPGMLTATRNNPSVETFRQIQATVNVLEPMALLVQAVNQAI